MVVLQGGYDAEKERMGDATGQEREFATRSTQTAGGMTRLNLASGGVNWSLHIEWVLAQQAIPLELELC